MLWGMLVVFVVHLAPARKGGSFLSEETLSETNAQVMTSAEARAVGFEGVPDDENVRLVAVNKRDKGFLQGALERAADVTGYQFHEVDL